MKVYNVHKRMIKGPAGELLPTLASREDKIWPKERWPAMRFQEGLRLNAKGGHGPIRYTITNYSPNTFIEFTFSRPKGFYGIHTLAFIPHGNKTEVIHTIDMVTRGQGT
ncbi:MAG: hypothetical protein AAF840_12335, partial [Bacteroidota bacterium]